MKQKTIFFRIRKKAKNRYMVEERHRFLWFWVFYIKGSIKLKLPKYFASTKLAEDAIYNACKKAGYKPFILMIE